MLTHHEQCLSKLHVAMTLETIWVRYKLGFLL